MLCLCPLPFFSHFLSFSFPFFLPRLIFISYVQELFLPQPPEYPELQTLTPRCLLPMDSFVNGCNISSKNSVFPSCSPISVPLQVPFPVTPFSFTSWHRRHRLPCRASGERTSCVPWATSSLTRQTLCSPPSVGGGGPTARRSLALGDFKMNAMGLKGPQIWVWRGEC